MILKISWIEWFNTANVLIAPKLIYKYIMISINISERSTMWGISPNRYYIINSPCENSVALHHEKTDLWNSKGCPQTDWSHFGNLTCKESGHFKKYFIHLFLEKGGGKEKERDRNINVWLPLVPLAGDLAWNPGTGPDWNRTVTLSFTGPHTSHWAIPARSKVGILYKDKSLIFY